MRCDEAREAIQEALSGEATPLDLAGRLPMPVHRHLVGCVACRAVAHDLLALERGMFAAMAEAPPPPPDMVARIMAGVQGAPVSFVEPAPAPRRGWVAAAGWLLALGGLAAWWGTAVHEDQVMAWLWSVATAVSDPLAASVADLASQAEAWMARVPDGSYMWLVAVLALATAALHWRWSEVPRSHA